MNYDAEKGYVSHRTDGHLGTFEFVSRVVFRYKSVNIEEKKKQGVFILFIILLELTRKFKKDPGTMTLNLKVMLRNRSQISCSELSSNRLQIVGRLQSAQLNNFIDVKRAPMIKFVG